MPDPKSRQRKFREKMQRLGFKELRSIYAHPDDEAAIKEFANEVCNVRRRKNTRER